MLTIISVIIITLNTLVVLSACKVAGRSDEWEEQLINDIKEKAYIR